MRHELSVTSRSARYVRGFIARSMRDTALFRDVGWCLSAVDNSVRSLARVVREGTARTLFGHRLVSAFVALYEPVSVPSLELQRRRELFV